MSEERCPRCKSDRVDYHCALGKIKHVCAQCGEEWGDSAGYHAASSRIAAEEAARYLEQDPELEQARSWKEGIEAFQKTEHLE